MFAMPGLDSIPQGNSTYGDRAMTLEQQARRDYVLEWNTRAEIPPIGRPRSCSSSERHSGSSSPSESLPRSSSFPMNNEEGDGMDHDDHFELCNYSESPSAKFPKGFRKTVGEVTADEESNQERKTFYVSPI